MRKIKIVADSACDLLSLKSVAFECAPMKIITEEKEFIDDKNLDVSLMADFFEHYKKRSQSSCPNTEDWLNAFGDSDDIFCVTITSGLSGSYNSACVAKETFEAENPNKRVFVLDTLSAGPEITLIVKKLEELINCGLEFEEICDKIQDYLKNTGLVFMLKSLNNFAANGRVSPLVAKITGLAGICIVGKASDQGTLSPTHKCRGESRSLSTLISDLEELGLKSGKVSIGHCQNETAANALKELIEENFEGVQTEIHSLRGLCSFYAEKGGLLVGFEKF